MYQAPKETVLNNDDQFDPFVGMSPVSSATITGSPNDGVLDAHGNILGGVQDTAVVNDNTLQYPTLQPDSFQPTNLNVDAIVRLIHDQRALQQQLHG